ncbi:universal stress protein [Haloglomus litoreum]|uniref:universal stress protein n=1 Tax=Haloglomus litoreum TaxID=3034026 RepID=UPI0023E784D3|nr:universal stress protein [Haloglomus sp. DT116]
MYDTILVPTDGSEAATAALDHAADLADEHDAEVHLLYVTESPAIAPTPAAGGVLEALERHGEEIVDEAAERLRNRRVHTAVARGSPHRAILDYAASNDVDLVVMGTHGRTGLSHALLGSVAERVVRLSPVPVLTVRHDEAVDGEVPDSEAADDAD